MLYYFLVVYGSKFYNILLHISYSNKIDKIYLNVYQIIQFNINVIIKNFPNFLFAILYKKKRKKSLRSNNRSNKL